MAKNTGRDRRKRPLREPPRPTGRTEGALLEREDLSPGQRARIDAELRLYEAHLEDRYRRQSDRESIRSKRQGYLETLVARELEAEDPEETKRESRWLVSANFWLSLAFIVLFVIGALGRADRIETIATSFSEFFIHNFSWFYVLVGSLSLVFLFYLAMSRFGDVVLGEPDERPEFSDLSWYAMLFSAGMGVGLLFWGGAEPVSHYLFPPRGPAASAQAARMAMVYVNFHWGLHAWAIYTLCAVGAAYSGFRKKKRYLVSSSIVDLSSSPALRKGLKVFADFVATLAVVFGVAAAMGMGVLKIAGGFEHAFGVHGASTRGHLAILAVITVLYVLSATTGLKKGIRILSNLNMAVAASLMLFLFLAGPTLFILKVMVDSVGRYLFEIFRLSFEVAPFTPAHEAWMGKWTLTWMTWWIAWAPFVGIFIARISKGRTIREVIVGALLFPSLFTLLWFSIFGGAALHLEIYGGGGIGHLVSNPDTVTRSLFALLARFPFSHLTSAVAIFLLFTFLVTSADSACFVIAMMTTEGDLDPGMPMKLLWGIILALLTAILVLGGGIKATSAAALTFAFPFSLVMVLIAVGLIVRLKAQVKNRRI